VFQLECKDIDVETGLLDTAVCSWAGMSQLVTVMFHSVHANVKV